MILPRGQKKKAVATDTFPLKYYLSERTAQSKHFNPKYFLVLSSLFGETTSLHRFTTLPEIEGPGWLYPIFLNSPYRVSRQLSAFKGNGIVFFDAIDREEREAIVSKHGMVTLDLIAECAFPRDEMFAGIHEGLLDCGIPAHQVCIVNGNILSERLYNEYCSRQGIGASSRVRMIPFHGCLWLLMAHNLRSAEDATLHATLEQSRSTLTGRYRSKAFVSFNGRLRPHRLHVVLYLLARGLLEKGHVSFLAYGHDGKMSEDHLRAMNRKMPFAQETSPHIPDLARRLPITLDVQLANFSGHVEKVKVEMPWASPDPRYYLDSYFSVVIDTMMFESGVLFLTPIIYKSIMNCHPFIYFGSQGALAELRKMDFQTFAPFIDEGYDAIEDPKERMRRALTEVERLANLPLNELHSLYCVLWPRLEHNFRRFWYQLPAEFSGYWQREIVDRIVA